MAGGKILGNESEETRSGYNRRNDRGAGKRRGGGSSFLLSTPANATSVGHERDVKFNFHLRGRRVKTGEGNGEKVKKRENAPHPRGWLLFRVGWRCSSKGEDFSGLSSSLFLFFPVFSFLYSFFFKFFSSFSALDESSIVRDEIGRWILN